jgi:hypothetical protein
VGDNPESESAVDDTTEVFDLVVEHGKKPAFLTDYWWREIRSIHNNAMIFLGLTATRPSVDSISLTEVLMQHVHKIVGAQGEVENADTYRTIDVRPNGVLAKHCLHDMIATRIDVLLEFLNNELDKERSGALIRAVGDCRFFGETTSQR